MFENVRIMCIIGENKGNIDVKQVEASHTLTTC